MASGIDQTMANAILDALYPNSGTKTIGSVTITGSTKTRLMTANGSDSAAGTELGASGGYSSGGAATSYAAASSGSKASSADVSWTNMPAATITGVETWDTSGTPLRIQWAGFASSVTTASGDTLTIPSGQQTAALT